MTSNEQAYIGELQKHASEARALFSNAQKPQRERMVVRAFLRCLGAPFIDDEIVASKDEPVDVVFRSARFQVMESLGGRKRGLDWITRQRLYQTVQRFSELLERYTPPKPLSFGDAAQMVAQNLAVKASHYGVANCARLDALVYVDLRNRYLWPLEPGLEPQVAGGLHRQGWRSVAMLFVPYAAVLTVRPDAPDLLKEKAGLVLNQWPNPEGLFDT
jgi:hypothetical protein